MHMIRKTPGPSVYWRLTFTINVFRDLRSFLKHIYSNIYNIFDVYPTLLRLKNTFNICFLSLNIIHILVVAPRNILVQARNILNCGVIASCKLCMLVFVTFILSILVLIALILDSEVAAMIYIFAVCFECVLIYAQEKLYTITAEKNT